MPEMTEYQIGDQRTYIPRDAAQLTRRKFVLDSERNTDDPEFWAVLYDELAADFIEYYGPDSIVAADCKKRAEQWRRNAPTSPQEGTGAKKIATADTNPASQEIGNLASP